ncbi:MAG: ParB/Srx family N-terminal domain-containing protein [Steroidobacteraceae bacterium]|jgi:ParB-like chromosome segregation protein Spo0J
MAKCVFHNNVDRIPGAASATSASLTKLHIEYIRPERLCSSPNNARTHSKKQLKQIARSIERFGFVNPVLIDEDLRIIAGHGRVAAAKMRGLREVPTVRLSNLSPAQRRAYVIADNRLAELAGWDRELLAAELQGLLDLRFDEVELTGFSLGEIDVLLDGTVEETAAAPDDELAVERSAVSRPGDLWILGSHQLLCGDEPLSCDLIVRRWQHYTGKVARLAGSDLTFAQVEASRLAGQSASAGESSGGQ